MPGKRGASVGQLAERNAKIAQLRADSRTFSSIAAELELDESTVRRGYQDHVATIGEHSIGSATALHDLVTGFDTHIERAATVFERTLESNRAVAIAAVKAGMRGLADKAHVLAVAGVLGVEGTRWQADRSAFREFLAVGLDCLRAAERGDITISVAVETFEQAFGLLEPRPVEPHRDFPPTAPRPQGPPASYLSDRPPRRPRHDPFYDGPREP